MDRRAHIVTHCAPAPVQRIALHDRAAAAAVGVVVHLVLPVGGVVADLVGMNFDKPLFLRAAENARAHHRIDRVREERQNIKAHRSASLQ